MAMATFSIRMDEDLKKEFDKVCSELGMSSSTAFNIFAKKVVKEKQIPFPVSTNTTTSFYSHQNTASSGFKAMDEPIYNGDYPSLFNRFHELTKLKEDLELLHLLDMADKSLEKNSFTLEDVEHMIENGFQDD